VTVSECDSLILADNNIHDNVRPVYCSTATLEPGEFVWVVKINERLILTGKILVR